jgi:septal ring factor EnvC (AmiA/AmiB activator)
MKEGSRMSTGALTRRSQDGKLLVPLLGLLAALAVGVAGFAIYLLIQKGEQLSAVQRNLQLAESENIDLKGRIETVQQEKGRLEESLMGAQREATQARAELAESVKAQETLTRSIEDREREIARLTKDLEQTQNESSKVNNQIAKLQQERDDARRQLADLERAKSDLESKLMATEQPTVELDKVFVSGSDTGLDAGMVMPASAVPGMPGADGQVVVINREYDFIVMNLGRNHGIAVGQEFQIGRGAEVLGRVKVEKVYDELSAAAILPDSKKNSIREGDSVRSL